MARVQRGIAKKSMIRMTITHSESFFFFILIHFLLPKSQNR
jgi:hypothetical protein